FSVAPVMTMANHEWSHVTFQLAIHTPECSGGLERVGNARRPGVLGECIPLVWKGLLHETPALIGRFWVVRLQRTPTLTKLLTALTSRFHRMAKGGYVRIQSFSTL